MEPEFKGEVLVAVVVGTNVVFKVEDVVVVGSIEAVVVVGTIVVGATVVGTIDGATTKLLHVMVRSMRLLRCNTSHTLQVYSTVTELPGQAAAIASCGTIQG